MELGRALVVSGIVRKIMLTTLIALSLAAWATPATAYVLQIAASIPVASADDDTQLKVALSSVIDDILQHAIAFAPTAVTVQDARVVGDRIYILLLIADGDGEETMRQLIDADQTEL